MVEKYQDRRIPIAEIGADYDSDATQKEIASELRSHGFSFADALIHAVHLLKHKKADPGPGVVYVEIPGDGSYKLDTCYQPIGHRSDREIIAIAEATGGETTDCDRLIIHEAKKRLR